MVCLIFTTVPPTVCPFSLLCGHRLSPPVRGRDILIDWGCIFYVPALCSQLVAGFCEFFFLACECHVLGVVCSSFFLNVLSAVDSCLCNVGQHRVKEIGAALQFERSRPYFGKINLYLNGFSTIYFLGCLHSYNFLTETCVLTESPTNRLNIREFVCL